MSAHAGDLSIAGIWWTESKDAKVEITDCGDGTPCASLYWAKEGSPKDVNNPDASLRDRDLIGSKMFWGFTQKGDKWKNGQLYNARSGKTYKAKLKVNSSGELEVRGCVGFLCDGENWTRVTD